MEDKYIDSKIFKMIVSILNRGWNQGTPKVDGEYLICEVVTYKEETYYRYATAVFSHGIFEDEWGCNIENVKMWKRIHAPRFV